MENQMIHQHELRSGLVLKMAKEDDFQEIIFLLKACDLITEDFSPVNIPDFFVIRNQCKSLIATIGLETFSNIGLLRSLAVEMNYRNQGIATILINETEKLASEKNLESLFLLTLSASSYFIKRSYTIVLREIAPVWIKQSKQFLELCPETSVIMQKKNLTKTTTNRC